MRGKSLQAGIRFLFGIALVAGIALWACKPGGEEVSALRLPDSTQVKKSPLGSGSATVPTQKRPKSSAGAQTNASGPSSLIVSGADPENNAGSTSTSKLLPPGSRNLWWNKLNIFFADYVSGTSDIVYEKVKGQPYFDETKIFVYCTDDALKGTRTYEKVELSMKETELDDRIFIWVHLDDNREPVFVRKLISDNIKDRIDQAPNRIE